MEAEWKSYGDAVAMQAYPKCSDPPVAKYPVTSDGDWWTGFQHLKPTDPELQAKYDAMSASWLGVTPTNQAVINGLFTSQPADADKSLPKYKK
jgi:hypothetical protein